MCAQGGRLPSAPKARLDTSASLEAARLSGPGLPLLALGQGSGEVTIYRVAKSSFQQSFTTILTLLGTGDSFCVASKTGKPFRVHQELFGTPQGGLLTPHR